MKYFKHFLCLLLTVTLVCSCIGCSKTASSSADDKTKGRYLEHAFTLPEYSDHETYANITSTKDGLPVLYTYTLETNMISVNTYTYEKDGTYVEDQPEWMKSIDVGTDCVPQLTLCTGSDDSQYLLVTEENEDDEDNLTSTLYKTTDGTSRQTLTMEGWDDVSTDGTSNFIPYNVGILDNGTLVVNSTNGLFLYNQEGEHTYTLDENHTYTSFSTQGNNILCYINNGGDETFTGIDVYDGTNPEQEPVSSRFTTEQEYTEAVSYNPSGDIIFVNSTGICLQKQGTTLWQTVVDGSLGTMYIPDVAGIFISEDTAENYYVMYYDYTTQNYSLIQYSYDADINTVPSQELTIYTLTNNNTLRKAAYVFQQNNPDVKVTIETAMTESEDEGDSSTGLTKSDYIQALNTQLLAHDGCDLLNLTDLPAETYAQKNVLLDLTDLVTPIEDTLLDNIIDSCRIDDHLYYIPAKFEFPILMAPQEICSNATDLQTLTSYLSTQDSSALFGNYTTEDLIEAFLPYVVANLTNDDGSFQPEVLSEFLSSMKTIADNSQIVDAYGDTTWKTFPYDLLDSVSICMVTLRGITDATYELSFDEYKNYDYNIFENSFTPSVEVAINASTKQPELAKEFLKTLLSYEVQVCDTEDGFPILQDALQDITFEKDEIIQYPLNDGSTILLPIQTFTDEEKDALITKIHSITTMTATDDNILEAITEYATPYINDEQSLDDTVAAIQNKLALYTAE